MDREIMLKNMLGQYGQSSQSFNNLNPTEWTEMTVNTDIPLRFVGNPPNSREVPSDFRLVESSFITDELGKTRYLVLQEPTGVWADSALNEMVKEFTKAFEDLPATAITQENNRLYQLLRYNGRPQPMKYETGWRSSIRLLANVIDRRRMAEHREAKKTFGLAKKIKEGKVDTAVSVMVFQGLLQILESSGDYQNFDVVLRRTTSKPFYALTLPPPQQFIDNSPADSPLRLLSLAPLTEEELSWSRIDLDTVDKVTDKDVLHSWIGQTVKKVDNFLGKDYYSRIFDNMASSKPTPTVAPTPTAPPIPTQTQAPIAPQTQAPVAPTPTATPIPQAPPVAPNPVAPNPVAQAPPVVPTPVVPTPVVPTPVVPQAPVAPLWQQISEGQVNTMRYSGIALLSDENKALIIGARDNAELIYHESATIVRRPESPIPLPDTFTHDPLSGKPIDLG